MNRFVFFMMGLALLFSCSEEKEQVAIDAFRFNVRATIADNLNHPEMKYTLKVIAKDHARGTVAWEKTFNLSASAKITIPDHHGHYTFAASKPGYIPHVQHYLLEDLMEDNLNFEFIPESLDGFILKKSSNEVVKVYLPNYQNRCKLYLRIDVAEGYYVDIIQADIRATDRVNVDVGEFIRVEHSADRNTIALGRSPLNVYNNMPFAEAEDYCEQIDLSLSSVAEELDDINFFSIFNIDCRRIEDDQPGVYFGFQSWTGLNNQ